MRYLILGGTGPMGTHLCDLLCDEDAEISVTSRVHRDDYDSIKYIEGDARDVDFLYPLLRSKWDVIVDFMVYENSEFEDRVSALLAATCHYIYLSSARVYDNSQRCITEECTRLLDTSSDKDFVSSNEYAISKARQEDVLKSMPLKNWTVIRPYITYGEERLQLGTLEKESWLYRGLKGRTIVFSDDIKNRVTTLTYGLDIARAMVKIIGNQKAFGEAYHITSQHCFKWSEILEVYLEVIEEATGQRPSILFQKLSDFMVWNPGKYAIQYDRMYDRKFDNSKINSLVLIDTFINPRDGLRKCLKSFLKSPVYKSISWRREAIKDDYCKEATPLSEIPTMRSKLIYLSFRYIPWLRDKI